MFFQFYDENLSSYLLSKILSYRSERMDENLYTLYLKFDDKEIILKYIDRENLVSDITSLHESLNDYYERMISLSGGQGMENVMGYGMEVEEPLQEEEYEEEVSGKRRMGFKF